MIEFMSKEVFNANADAIRSGVRVLVCNAESRKRFRIAAVYERSTGVLLAEAFRTNFGPVVVIYQGPRERLDADGRQVVPLTGNDQRFQVKAQRGQPAVELFNVGDDASPYWLSGQDLIARTSPNDALVLR